MKKEGKKTIIAIIVLIIIIISLLIYSAIVNNKKEENTLNEQNIIQTGNDINPNLSTDLDMLSQLQQYDRIKYYFDKYLFYVEEQDYESAYNLLYDEFKQEHFKTVEEFTQYVTSKYPVVNTIEYTGYDKLGPYHILTIKFSDVLNATNDNVPSFEQKYIIIENGLNDYKISFQAQ